MVEMLLLSTRLTPSNLIHYKGFNFVMLADFSTEIWNSGVSHYHAFWS